MEIFFKVSSKELLDVRNKLFLTHGIPALNRNGFKQSPFSTEWFGRNELKGFTYELCRLNSHSHLEKITVHISRGDSWIKIFLNIFELHPKIKSLEQLDKLAQTKFGFPPNNLAEMRLRSDGVKGLYFFHFLFGKEHKIGSYSSKNGFDKRIEELSKLIESDLNNIAHFVERWYEIHTPQITDWSGEKIDR